MWFWFALLFTFTLSTFSEDDIEGFDHERHGTHWGDENVWHEMFHDMELELIGTGLGWTEGPVWVSDVLLFSSTTHNIMYNWGEENVMYNDHENHHHEVFENSGDCGLSDTKEKEEGWRLEPGSNGMYFDKEKNRLYYAQHCARRIKVISVALGRTLQIPGLDEFEGKRFNSPNDLVLFDDHIFFTDPLYGHLEKERPYDDPYLDTKGDMGGIEGIYSVSITNGTSKRLKSDHRPNGIAVFKTRWEEDLLIYSQCCQGVHCDQGVARWHVHELEPTGDQYELLDAPKRFKSTIEHVEEGVLGCADGLTTLPEHLFGKKYHENYFIASCPKGICVICMKTGEVVFKLKTGMRVSNMAFGDDGWLYVTAENSLWRIPSGIHSYVSSHYHGDDAEHHHGNDIHRAHHEHQEGWQHDEL